MSNSTFEVRDFVTSEWRANADSYLDAATKANELANAEQAAFTIKEIITRCVITPSKGTKDARILRHAR